MNIRTPLPCLLLLGVTVTDDLVPLPLPEATIHVILLAVDVRQLPDGRQCQRGGFLDRASVRRSV
jgi:hypothetical protein